MNEPLDTPSIIKLHLVQSKIGPALIRVLVSLLNCTHVSLLSPVSKSSEWNTEADLLYNASSLK